MGNVCSAEDAAKYPQLSAMYEDYQKCKAENEKLVCFNLEFKFPIEARY
jgi:hypothetical protein